MNKIIFLFVFCYSFAYADSILLQNKNIFNSIDNSLKQDTICISTYNNDDKIPTQFDKKEYVNNNYDYYRGGEKDKNGNYNFTKIKTHFYTFKIFGEIPIIETLPQNPDIPRHIGYTITLKNFEKYNNNQLEFLTKEEILDKTGHEISKGFISPFFIWKNYSAPVNYRNVDFYGNVFLGQNTERVIDNVDMKINYSVYKKLKKIHKYWHRNNISYVSYVKCYTKK